MDPARRFADLVAGSEAALPLDELAVLLAAHARPELDVASELRRLDELAAGVPAPTLDGVRRHLFRDLGFTGNEDEYYDARNSYLPDVLDRRTGIPISLAVVVLEVGRRVGVPLSGVSMPGHFLLRDKVDPEVFLDPFARGAVLDRRGCEARFRVVQGPGAVFDPSFLEPVGKRSIVQRMLANLETVALRDADRPLLTWALRLRAAMPGAGPGDKRKLASVLASGGQVIEAAQLLEELVPELPDDVAEKVASTARRLRARLN